MRSLWLSAAVACSSLLTPAAAASVAASALSVDASAGLRAAQLSLTSALLEQPALLEELCAIPLRGAEPLHHWEAAELHEEASPVGAVQRKSSFRMAASFYRRRHDSRAGMYEV